jgi:hypothetical protein
MEAGVPEQRVRSRRRVVGWLAGIVCFETLLFWALSDRTPPTQRNVVLQSSFLLLTEPGVSRQVSLALAPLDPLLFASAHPRGFSGTAWLQPRHNDLHVQDWTESRSWLAPDSDPSLFSQREAMNRPASAVLSVVDKVPPPTGRIVEHTEPLPLRSVLRSDGLLELRREPAADFLRVWTNQTTLQPTVIEVVANPEGEIVSQRVLASSGLPAADQEASRLSKSLRILPSSSPASQVSAPRQSTRVGQFTFDWAVSAPASTNRPAK